LKHVASAKLELELAGAKISAAENRFATNFEVFENDLMVDIADLLLYGQVWHVAETIRTNKNTAEVGNIASIISKKILTFAKEINRRGKFTQIPLQKLIKMQLGSILILADILANSS